MPTVAHYLALIVVLGWTQAASAQDHAAHEPTPSKAAARAAARPVADATRDAGKHVPPAVASDAHTAKPTVTNDAHAAKPPADGEHRASDRDTGEHAAPARTASADPSAKSAASGASARMTKHLPAAPEPRSESASAPSDKTPSRPATRLASNKELDVVMDRISKRISAFSGEGGRRAVAPEESTARSTVGPRLAARKPARERVHITWMPTVVWPGALLGTPASAAPGAADADSSVHLKWNSLQP